MLHGWEVRVDTRRLHAVINSGRDWPVPRTLSANADAVRNDSHRWADLNSTSKGARRSVSKHGLISFLLPKTTSSRHNCARLVEILSSHHISYRTSIVCPLRVRPAGNPLGKSGPPTTFITRRPASSYTKPDPRGVKETAPASFIHLSRFHTHSSPRAITKD